MYLVIVSVRQQLYKIMPATLVLRKVISQLENQGTVTTLSLLARLFILGWGCDMFNTQVRDGMLKTLPVNCSPVSVSTYSDIPYALTQMYPKRMTY